LKNQHLIPINIIDLVDKINDPRTNENERNNYILRLETIKNFCEITIKKDKDRKLKKYSSGWESARDYSS
jgi:hypothetical protein